MHYVAKAFQHHSRIYIVNLRPIIYDKKNKMNHSKKDYDTSFEGLESTWLHSITK